MSNKIFTSVINPYKLMGIDVNSNICHLKKNYHTLSKLLHPDVGGSKDDFIVLTNCYNYILKAFKNRDIKNTTYENLEEDFQNFCNKQQKIIIPFYQIFKDCEENKKFKKFNEKFEEMRKLRKNDDENPNPFTVGYGNLMESSEKIKINNYDNILKKKNKKIKNQFKNIIVKYKDPYSLPLLYGNYYHLNIKKIKDFSNITKTFQVTDYKKAFSTQIKKIDIKIKKRSLEDIIKERKIFDNKFKNIDFKNNIK